MYKGLKTIIKTHKRIAIVGGPLSGKTTLANYISDRMIIHGDDFMYMDWSKQSAYMVEITRPLNKFIIEGVQIPRALRKGMVVDVVIYLNHSFGTLNNKQQSMKKGMDKIFNEWKVKNKDIPIYYL